MGFIKPKLPDLDYEEWRTKPRMERIKPMCQDWAVNGFGPPESVYVLYVLKLFLYVLGIVWITSLTPGIGSLSHIRDWWTEPILVEKAVVFTVIFELLGIGCGFGPLTLKFLPPIGSPLYWLRPGTIRLPPWPDKVPGTKGSTRTVVDVALFAGVLASGVWLLFSPGSKAGLAGTSVGLIEPVRTIPLLVTLGLLGLRDKAIFLAARSEVYLPFVIAFAFPPVDMIVSWKLTMMVIWWGAATSKINHHFGNVIEVMESNSPFVRIKAWKRLMHRDAVNDVRPSDLAGFLAHLGTVLEFLIPLALFVSGGGAPTKVAAIGMLLFHLHILSTLPIGAPFEWNIFMIFGIFSLFVHHAALNVGDVVHPVPVLALTAAMEAVVILGNFFPEKFSFLLSMRYYAGNWATSMWCLKPSAVAKFPGNVKGFPGFARAQMGKIYDERTADLLAHKGYAFRAMHSHGRALFGLVPRAAGPDHEGYLLIDGEFVASPTIGWNFGEGHLHDEQLLAALQERCSFEPGEVRVVMIESSPMFGKYQNYRLVDAATGEFERGRVKIADMLARQPWAGEIPVELATTTPASTPTVPLPSETATAGA
jgi:hypothetical protein